MKKYLLIILLGLTSTMYSQDSLVTETNQHLLGVHAGVSTGIGLSYKFIHKKFGIQLTGIPIFDDENVWTSAGGALSYRIQTSEINKEPLSVLLYCGIHHLYSKQNGDSFEIYSGDLLASPTTKSHFNTAVGFGLEYTTEDTFMINIMAGYGLILDGSARTTLAFEIGVHYKI
jgi:hypothetical protein